MERATTPYYENLSPFHVPRRLFTYLHHLRFASSYSYHDVGNVTPPHIIHTLYTYMPHTYAVGITIRNETTSRIYIQIWRRRRNARQKVWITSYHNRRAIKRSKKIKENERPAATVSETCEKEYDRRGAARRREFVDDNIVFFIFINAASIGAKPHNTPE